MYRFHESFALTPLPGPLHYDGVSHEFDENVKELCLSTDQRQHYLFDSTLEPLAQPADEMQGVEKCVFWDRRNYVLHGVDF